MAGCALVPRLTAKILGESCRFLEEHPVAMALKRLGSLSTWRAVFVQESRFLSLEGL